MSEKRNLLVVWKCSNCGWMERHNIALAHDRDPIKIFLNAGGVETVHECAGGSLGVFRKVSATIEGAS